MGTFSVTNIWGLCDAKKYLIYWFLSVFFHIFMSFYQNFGCRKIVIIDYFSYWVVKGLVNDLVDMSPAAYCFSIMLWPLTTRTYKTDEYSPASLFVAALFQYFWPRIKGIKTSVLKKLFFYEIIKNYFYKWSVYILIK